MSVQVTILGDGDYAGASTNISDYSINEDGSPLDLSNVIGGVGGITFQAIEDPSFNGSMLLPRQPFRLVDPYSGAVRGVIDGGTGTDGYSLDIQASSSLLPLVSTRTLPAVTGALGNVLTQWFEACGMSDAGFQIDPTLALKQVTLPSWTGDVWTQVKKLMAIHKFEIGEVDGAIIIRPLRKRSVDVTRYTSSRITYGQDSAYQTVEVYYYNNKWEANKWVYPPKDSTVLDREIITVNASEEVTQNLPVDMWVSTISNPVQQTSLPWDEANPITSVYAVVDKDGAPVSANDWRNGGGFLKVAIGPDRKSIDVTVRGMSTDSRAPYRIASSSQDRTYQYAALHLVATGVSFDRKLIWSPTGASLLDAPVDAVKTIDDPLVSTRAEAEYVLSIAAQGANGFSQTFEAETTHINRRGEVGAYLYPSFEDFNDSLPSSYQFGEWDSANPTKTFKQLTAEQGELVKDTFANQAFGGIGGARVRERNSMYRITSGRAGPGGFSWTAESDTLFSDWTAAQDSATTFSQYNARWSGRTFEQHNRQPLYSG